MPSSWKTITTTALAVAGTTAFLLLAAAVHWIPTTIGAVAAGLAAAGMLHREISILRRELRHEADRIEALAQGTPAPPAGNDPTLAVLRSAVDQSINKLRRDNIELSQSRRELGLQLRIAEAEQRHAEAILNSIADAVIVTDAFNEVILANPAASRVLEFDLDQVLRRPVDQVVRDAPLAKLIKDTRESGDRALRRHVEHRVQGNTGATYYDVSLNCIQSSRSGRSAEPAGVITILRDVTREKTIAEMKSDFVSNVSHELRTPLSSIKAYVEMLVDGEATDEQTRAEFYNIIQGETTRLQRLIDNILNINRIESGIVRVQREHVGLPRLVHEVIEVMRPQARAKRIELVEVPTPLFFQVFADKDMIYQATLNLVSNAIKYTREGGRVTVSIHIDEQGRTVSVAVADNGVGIPPDDLPHVFDKFYRVNDHKKMARGTGLGLALVRQIIETVHAGKIDVKSTVGTGSTFTFTLPLADNG